MPLILNHSLLIIWDSLLSQRLFMLIAIPHMSGILILIILKSFSLLVDFIYLFSFISLFFPIWDRSLSLNSRNQASNKSTRSFVKLHWQSRLVFCFLFCLRHPKLVTKYCIHIYDDRWFRNYLIFENIVRIHPLNQSFLSYIFSWPEWSFSNELIIMKN